ncbi:AAA family ATPase [Nesterenkonia sp. HG001]|uniref:AAA family ATPase n=1 Tax=Nesterenkonia sp. HG001 TaxID=2983207 RepID=UPI002AC4A4D4|nr:AAA family ATPase [Nesterenkonia sp. HG001]MDZ5076245.1 AAA family ATPase [Nesterenkonia sp. HG001]
MAAARAGWADAALIIGQTDALTGSLLTELTEPGIVVVVVSDVAVERTRLRNLGALALPDDVDVEVLVDALRGRPVPDELTVESVPGVASGDCAGVLPAADPQAVSDSDAGPPAAGADPLDDELADLLRSTGQQESPDLSDVPDWGSDRDADGGSEHDADGDADQDADRDAELESDDSSVSRADVRPIAPGETRIAGITTVWGAPGSPGRTTLAVNLAAELALTGAHVLLIDADTVASSVAAHLGLLEESAGLAQACRQADLGRLDSARLRRAATVVDISGSRLRMLTGLPRADRWPELREGALRQVLQLADRDFDHVIVDVAAPTEQDEELTFDTRAPQRNAATVVAVEEAHTLLAVGAPDPVSFPRLIKGLDDLRLNVPQAPRPLVLINQTRREAVGRAPEDQLREAWRRFGSEEPLEIFLPWDRAACDDALLTGRVLAESAPQSALRRAVAELAGADLPTRRRRRLRR